MKEIFRFQKVPMAVDYWLGRVRLVTPVPVGSRLRATRSILDTASTGGGLRAPFESAIELEHRPWPACVSQTIVECKP